MPNEIVIEYEVWKRIFNYAHAAYDLEKAETGGYLIVDELKDGGLKIIDTVVPDQEVTGGHVEFATSGDWLKQLKGRTEKVRGWWHSHHNMFCSYSGEDTNTLEDKWNPENKNGNHYAIGIVVSFPDKMTGYIAYYKPIALKKVELDVKVLNPPDVKDALYLKCEAEIKSRLKKKVYQWDLYRNSYGNGSKGQFRNADDDVIIQELPDKHKETDDKKWDEEKSLGSDYDPELLILDDVSGYSIAELKQKGMWDPCKYPDLLARLEVLQSFHAKGANTGHTVYQFLHRKDCTRLYKNERNRMICSIHGKDYNCKGCKNRDVDESAVEDKQPEESAIKQITDRSVAEATIKAIDTFKPEKTQASETEKNSAQS